MIRLTSTIFHDIVLPKLLKELSKDSTLLHIIIMNNPKLNTKRKNSHQFGLILEL
jgi:hypothetical protein